MWSGTAAGRVALGVGQQERSYRAMLRAAAPRSAQQLAGAVDAVLRGSATSDATLARHQSERDRLPGPFSRTIDRIAAFDWDLGAVRAHLLPASKVMQAEVRTIEIADGKEAAA